MSKCPVLFGCLTLVVGIAIWLLPKGVEVLAHASRSNSSESASYVTGQFIVKFKPSLTACAHCLLARHRRFQSAVTDGSDSLDRLNQQVRVRAARSLFQERHGLTTTEAQQRLRDRLQEIRTHFAQRSRRAARDVTLPDLTNTYLFEVSPETDIETLCALYRADPHVEYAQPNYIAQAQFIPNDPYYSSSGSWGQRYDDLWGLKKMQTSSAWDLSQGQGTIVAVVDTGLDYNHPDIAANVWTNPGEIPNNGRDDDSNGYIDDVRGWDFSNNDSNPMDGYGHGTHVSGTIAAVGNNNLGIIGVAPQAKVMPVKGLDDSGVGTLDNLAQSLVYAAQNGADVVNNSWGCSSLCPSNPVIEEAVRTAHGLGAVVVFSAGNSSRDVASYSPQNMTDPKPIVVAASDQNDSPTYFTNIGWLIDVAAPGGGTTVGPPTFEPFRNVLSLKSATVSTAMTGNGRLIVGTRYLRQAGTSMAAPHVSGLAALILAYRSTFTNDDVRHVMRASADDVASSGFDRETGAGRLNAARALAVPSVLQVKITSPASQATLSQRAGGVTITGTAAGADFQQYALFYAQDVTPTSWKTIGGSVLSPVVNGVLGTWPLWGLADGTCALRLAATTRNGTQFQEVVQVALQHNPSQPITTDPADQINPAISGNRIVWTDLRNGNVDIYLYDLVTNTERRITSDPSAQQAPAISGNRVVWQDYRNGNWDIYLYDLATSTERRITTNLANQYGPAISGNRIVWVDGRNGNWDIYLYDLATNTERPITTNPANQYSPTISGNRIVWQDLRNSIDNYDIYLYDLSTNTERAITTNPATQSNPVISGDRIVWQDWRNGNFDIYLYDLTTNAERRITTDPDDQTGPVISGDRIVWQDLRNDNFDVYLYDLATNTERPITSEFAPQLEPEISGERIAWRDSRNGNADIYLLTLNSKPALEPLSNKVIGAGKLLVFPVKATDPDEELLTLTATNRPAGSSFLPKGDVTQNGSLEQADVDRINACVAGTSTCTYAQVQLGDVAGPSGLTPDGKLTNIDAQTVQAMLTERANPGHDLALLDLLNTSVLLWQTNTTQADADPYWATFRATDAEGALAEATVPITVDNGGTNLLSNGGFEADKTDWSVWWAGQKERTTALAYTGTAAAKFTLGPSATRRLTHADIPVTAGASYRVFAAIKAVSIGTGRASVELKWRKPGGTTARIDTFGTTSGTTEWIRYLSPTYAVPTGATKLEVNLVTDPGSGTAYFDAVRLEQVQ